MHALLLVEWNLHGTFEYTHIRQTRVRLPFAGKLSSSKSAYVAVHVSAPRRNTRIDGDPSRLPTRDKASTVHRDTGMPAKHARFVIKKHAGRDAASC